MGNNVSSHPLLSVTLADCYVDGSLNVYKFQIFLLFKRKRENDEFFHNLRNSSSVSSESQPPQKRRKREVKKHNLEIEDTNGAMTILTPQKSIWYSFYV